MLTGYWVVGYNLLISKVAWPSGKAEACKASIPQFESGCHLTLLVSIMLYLVSTPIGNLSDMSFRAVETLKNSDLVLCEDTRHSLKLLSHYGIQKPLQSYHKFNEKQKTEELISKLKEGKTISLISDAGTPLISDPGHFLVQACIESGIEVVAIPGPCALIHALVCSGFSSERFQFVGFLPKKDKELRQHLNDLIEYPGVSIAYESPERIEKTVQTLAEINPEVLICISRELTKKFETHIRGTATSIVAKLIESPIKGECVLLIEGKPSTTDFSDLSLEEHVEHVQKTYQVPKREAIKIVASLRNLNKRDLYRSIHLH